MAEVKPFDLDEALSGSPKEIGSVPWVSAQTLKVQQLCPLAADKNYASVTTTAAHGLIEGDSIYLTGFEPRVDGKYAIQLHPHADKAYSFLIEMPPGLNGRDLSSGSVRKSQQYSVTYSDHLHLEGTFQLKELGMRKERHNLMVSKQSEAIQSTVAEELKVTALAKKYGILPNSKDSEERTTDKKDDPLEKFASAIRESASLSEPSLVKSQVEAIAKEFNITKKAFLKEAEGIIASYRDVVMSMDINPKSLTEVFNREATRINKREVEILCCMPEGLMDALDNFAGAEKAIQQISQYVRNVHQQVERQLSAGTEGNEKAEPEEPPPNPSESTGSTSSDPSPS